MNFSSKTKRLVMLSVFTLFLVVLDQITKSIIIARFFYGESTLVLPPIFSLTYVRNPGAAFGLLSQWDSQWRVPFFVIIPFLAFGVILAIFRKLSESEWKLGLGLSFVMGGAFGNLIDRARLGYVVDFLDFHWGVDGVHFPAFNVADIAICVGVGLLMIDMYFREKAPQTKKDAPSNVAFPKNH